MQQSKMTKKQSYHHGDLRQALISAALAILKTKDAKSLSLREVARQAGVSHTAPYRHFTDKAALLASVAEEGFVEFGKYLQTAVDHAGGDPLKSLQETGVAYVRYALEHPTHFRVMFSSVLAEDLTGSCHDNTLDTVAKGTFQILVDIIKAGQTSGVIRAGDPDFLALGAWATTHGLSMLLLDEMLPEKGEAALQMAEGIIHNNAIGLIVSQA